ncbi:lytic transglycosylase [Mycolicibacterium peregrinum]|uniref:lytic transglycosylase domain-containing protein n=1 Tax=Mycolicibacterium peregrinum TaxID=43304 RepID=UPI0006D76A03|nr:lytic transglycosylase domain-containing protein [Mycolicibacterium peregrinum]MCV7200547.1 lytic transglycosylase domain-containing protein [Mycolicibacterium peregrinum]ORW59987.1 lytic transglycosylase [Mycolicibacterium peregrinum]OWL98878.1 lytic transglycosylase [Mycolicibacterium peregrinum]
MPRIARGLAILFALGAVLSGCSGTSETSGPDTQTTTTQPSTTTKTTPAGAQPRLAADPGRLAQDLIADERALRDPSTPETTLTQAARRQQVAYRAIGRHPEWDAIIRARIPAELVAFYDHNVDARRQLAALAEPKDTLPAWRINPPAPPQVLLDAYREAEAASGVGWNFLAAINLIETHFGSVTGDSSAGAQGPMQFMPSTFAAYGLDGDIHSPRDSIMAAGNYLAANGFAHDPDHALFRYNNADEYVRAVTDYAAAMAADPAAFGAFYRWDVYYVSTAGDVLLPIGYAAESRIPVGEYLTAHPQ